MSQNTRAEVLVELKVTPRCAGRIDGTTYEVSHEMFMSRLSPSLSLGSRALPPAGEWRWPVTKA